MDLIGYSIGPEVYAINLIIGLLIFFILRWAFKRMIRTNQKLRVTLTWVGTIILTPVIYVGLILMLLSVMLYQPSREFDRERWFADKATRHEMRDDIVDSQVLEDKSENEVLDLLGPPDIRFETDTTNIWNYDLGVSQVGFGWQFNSLLITFDNGLVLSVEKKEIGD